jgi:hypothetical protein
MRGERARRDSNPNLLIRSEALSVARSPWPSAGPNMWWLRARKRSGLTAAVAVPVAVNR